MIRVALVSLIAAVVLAQQQPPPRPSVAGIVVTTTGDPVRKATVILRAQDPAGASYTADSDGNGRFAIYDVQAGSYAVSADRDGFESDAEGAPGAPAPRLKVEAGQSVTDVKIKLVPLGVITGRVLDEDGDPVRGAQVEAMGYSYLGGKKELRTLGSVSANDKGEFRLFGLRPGTVYLHCPFRNGRFTSRHTSGMISESFAPTYFPGTTDVVHAAPIEVAAGAQLRGFDIRLRHEPLFSIRGKLPAVAHEGVQRMVQLMQRGGGGRRGFSQQQDNENFQFMDLLPGSYIVFASILEEGKHSIARQIVEVVNADVEGVVLNVAPTAEVSGVVRVEGTPVHPPGEMNVNLRADMPSIFGGNNVQVKPDGSFVIPDVMPDVYEVVVGTQPGFYVKSTRLGDAEAPDGRIDLTQGSGPLTVLLGTDVGEVEGSVKKANGDAAVRVRVTLIAYGNHLSRIDLSRSAFTDDQGKFHLRNVAPGDYRLFAWEDVPVGAPQDADFRKPFEKQSVAVKMEPNGRQTVELTAISVKPAH